jgi:hypothetical protein
VLLSRDDAAKDAEILVLQQEVAAPIPLPKSDAAFAAPRSAGVECDAALFAPVITGCIACQGSLLAANALITA